MLSNNTWSVHPWITTTPTTPAQTRAQKLQERVKDLRPDASWMAKAKRASLEAMMQLIILVYWSFNKLRRYWRNIGSEAVRKTGLNCRKSDCCNIKLPFSAKGSRTIPMINTLDSSSSQGLRSRFSLFRTYWRQSFMPSCIPDTNATSSKDKHFRIPLLWSPELGFPRPIRWYFIQ